MMLHKLVSLPFRSVSAITLCNYFVRNCERTICTSVRYLTAYESDGKTTVNILNNEENAPLMVNAYSAFGFRLNNGVFVMGPVALFSRTILGWNVGTDEDINEKSLSLFLHLAPKVDVLLIGMSDARNRKLIEDKRREVYEMMKNFKKEDKFNIEVLPTEKAVTTYNFLNADGRFVGAALIPPVFYTPTLDDEYRTEYLNKKKEMGPLISLT